MQPVTLLDDATVRSVAQAVLWYAVGEGEKHRAGKAEVYGVIGTSKRAGEVTEGYGPKSHRSYFLSTCPFPAHMLLECMGLESGFVNRDSLEGKPLPDGTKHLGYRSPGFARTKPWKAKTDGLSLLKGHPCAQLEKADNLGPGDVLIVGYPLHVACVLASTPEGLWIVQFGQTGKDKSGIDGRLSFYPHFDGSTLGSKRVLKVLRLPKLLEWAAEDETLEPVAMAPDWWAADWTWTPPEVLVMPRTLRLGATLQPEVSDWRKVLGLPPDGPYGPAEVALTKAWQTRHGLLDDGVVGQATWGSVREH